MAKVFVRSRGGCILGCTGRRDLRECFRIRGEELMRSWLLLAPALLAAQGMRVEPFAAEVRTVHNAASGLLSDDVLSVAVDSSRAAWAATGAGLAQWPYPCSKAATESSPRV